MDRFQKEMTKEELLLRDYLAADRTMLAVDRTFLAYIRTALTLFVAGVSFIKFFDTFFIQSMGWIFIVSGIAIFIFGLKRRVLVSNLVNKQKVDTKVQAEPNIASFTSFNLTLGLKQAFANAFRFLLASVNHPEVKN